MLFDIPNSSFDIQEKSISELPARNRAGMAMI
jgi:hypothetical protein